MPAAAAAVQMGLIYVNPEGPNGNGDPLSAAKDNRETFAQTNVESFEYLRPAADGFRNHAPGKLGAMAEFLLVDKAQLLTLTAPEMTVLVGGLRVLGANASVPGMAYSLRGRASSRTISS